MSVELLFVVETPHSLAVNQVVRLSVAMAGLVAAIFEIADCTVVYVLFWLCIHLSRHCV